MASSSAYDVFVSYRRDGGAHAARAFESGLSDLGLRVFLDVSRMQAGRFEQEIARVVRSSADFVVVLTPGCFEPREGSDHFLDEIALALGEERNIVPVVVGDPQDSWRNEIPERVAALADLHALHYSHEHHGAVIERLAGMLSSKPRFSPRRMVPLIALLGIAGLLTWTGWKSDGPPQSSVAMVPPLALYWSGHGKGPRGNRTTVFDLEDQMTMYSGDQFRLVVSPTEDCYLYVLSARTNEVSVHFPSTQTSLDNYCSGGHFYEIPSGRGWFTLDEEIGVETIYLVASYDQILDFEPLLGADSPANPVQLLDRVTADLAALPLEEARTRDGIKVDTRGIELQPDLLALPDSLGGGRNAPPMSYVRGTVHVVGQIRINHAARSE